MSTKVRVVVIAFGVLILLLPVVWRGFVSAAVTIHLLVPHGEWRPLVWATAEPTWHDSATTTADGRELVVRIYEVERPAQFGLVIYTPLIGGGLDDERLVNLAEAWSRVGIPVAVPWSDDGVAIRPSDTEEVIAAAEVLQSRTSVQQLGLFGISYGNGPVFQAAVDERLRDRVSAVISLNGMYDVAHVVAFIDSGRSHEYGREVVAATRAAGVDVAAVRERLSPAAVVDQIMAPVYVVHSLSDQFIPYTESVALHEALQARGKMSRLILTDVIEHGTYRPVTWANFFDYYLPAGAGFLALIYEILGLR